MVRLVVVVALAVFVSGASALGANRKPLLRYDGGPPAKLTGSNFTPHSVVRIFITGSKSSTFKLRATARGQFVLAVPQSTSKCKALIVQAVGVRGERASWGIGTTCGDPGIGDAGN